MSEARRLPAVALGLAALAVVLSAIATVVVIVREPGAAASESARPAQDARQVEVTDLVALERDRDRVEPASRSGAVIGVRVTDPDLRHALGLGDDDVITAMSGRPIRRQFDIHDVIAGASLMNTSALFVELMRGDSPALVRWDLAGDLRTARRSTTRRTPPGSPSPASPLRPVRDPLIDTITQTDDHHMTAPRATIEQIAANPALYAQGARVLRSYGVGSRPAGVRLSLVRPTSVLYALGLRSMDTITAVNGITVDDPGKLADVYDEVKAAATLRIEIDRRGSAEVIEITQTP